MAIGVLLSNLPYITFDISVSASFVLLFFLKPYLFLARMSHLLINIIILLCIIFSRTFAIFEIRDIGL